MFKFSLVTPTLQERLKGVESDLNHEYLTAVLALTAQTSYVESLRAKLDYVKHELEKYETDKGE